MDGKGAYKFANGDVYEGSYKEGLMHGKGNYNWKSGAKYSGDYSEDKRHGKGQYQFKSGDRYDGAWQENKMHGKGNYMYLNGDVYQGDYVSNKQHGVQHSLLTSDNGTPVTLSHFVWLFWLVHCLTLSRAVPHCLTMSHSVLHRLTLSHTVSRCLTPSHSVSLSQALARTPVPLESSTTAHTSKAGNQAAVNSSTRTKPAGWAKCETICATAAEYTQPGLKSTMESTATIA